MCSKIYSSKKNVEPFFSESLQFLGSPKSSTMKIVDWKREPLEIGLRYCREADLDDLRCT